MSRKIKWGTIIPLIGGMPVANKQTTGEDPTFLLSYEPFASNDSHCVNYFKESPYLVIDEHNKLSGNYDSLFSNVDFVTSCAPCAGLSMLNSVSSGESNFKRGADAIQNDWLYKSAEFVLDNIKPLVYWGENAPNLYTSAGKSVLEKLTLIANERGYTFSIMKTDTYLHGIPQHRQRTFYFMWKGQVSPILNYFESKTPHIIDYLNLIPIEVNDESKLMFNDLHKSGWWQWAKSRELDVRKIEEQSIKEHVFVNNLWDDVISFTDENNPLGDKKELVYLKKICTNAKKKLEEGKEYWDESPKIVKDRINALISKNLYVHPLKDRYLTQREAMWLMGLPHDFNLVNSNQFQITQNVPVKTASDWTSEVVKWCLGEHFETIKGSIKQNNKTKRVEWREEQPLKTTDLF